MFDESINTLKEVYSKVGSSARVDDYTINKSIFLTLDAVRGSVESASEKSFSNANLAVLEDVCAGSNVALVRSTLVNLVAIYTAIVKKAPGYVVRNILNAMIGICNSKTAANASRECAVLVTTAIMVHKPNDCANQSNEIVTLLTKLVKLTDLPLKIACIKALSGIIAGSGSKLADLHPEMLKLAVRFSADKSVEIRTAVADVMRLIAVNSVGFTTVPVDTVLAPATRGLEDETAVVQDAFASAVAAIFCEQVNAYVLSQEQAKVGAARGSSSKTPKKPAPLSQRMSITKLTMTTKKIVEEWDFKSVVTYLQKQLTTGSSTLRTGYLTVLGYLVRTLLETLTPEEFEWLVISTIEVLKDSPALRELTYEEQAYMRCRFSHFLRASIIAAGSEAQLLSFVTLLIKHISTVESNAHSDLELQLVLSEVSHVVGILGPAATALVEEVNMGASIYLRHSNFGVRAAAAQVLGGLAVSVPVIATEFLRSALLSAQSQVKQLLQFDPIELTSESDSGAPMSEADMQQAQAAARRRNSKEQERLQRIYFFHGHTLVMSVMLKHAAALPSGLPRGLVDEMFCLGIELLQQDVMSVPPIVRHVVCSVVRAGSLIVASCLSMGYATAATRLPQLLGVCETIFQAATAPASASSSAAHPPQLAHSSSTGSLNGQIGGNGGATKTDELVYEVMCVEAALVCLSTILRFCPEVLLMGPGGADGRESPSSAPGYLRNVVEGLDCAFKAVRNKYQPRLRTHFRFRTLHAMLLECFTLLPQGSFPNTCQSVFVEALRVFRDGVAAGYETTLLSNYLPDQFGVLSVGAGQASVNNVSGAASQAYLCEAPMSEHFLMMKLEMHATALQKKENEAFLSIFAKDAHTVDVLTSSAVLDAETRDGAAASVAPCANLDARTIDAAVALLGVTFSHQSVEYQDKAVQLCAQALVQFAKAGGKSTMGMFSSVSEEEKRRKDRMNYSAVRNVLATLSAIIHAYPVHLGAEEEIPWRQTMVTVLYDMLAHSSYMVRGASASSLALFSDKVRSAKVVDSVSFKIRGLMMASLEKRVADPSTAQDNTGYLVALSALWRAAAGSEDVKSLISTTVFDSMRKVSSSVPFRAQGLLTLSVFVQDFLDAADANAAGEAQDMLEKVLGVVEAHVSNVNYSTSSPTAIAADEIELFSVCLQRLLIVCCALSLRLYNEGVIEADAIHTRFNTLRQGVFCDLSSAAVRSETLNFFKYVVPVDTQGKYTSLLLAWLRDAIRKSAEYSLAAINVALCAVLPLLKKHSSEACKIGLDAALFTLLDSCCARSAVSHANAFSGIETRKGALLPEDASASLIACMNSAVTCIYTICEEDVKASPDTRIVHWVLMCRCIALNTRSTGRADDAEADGGAQAGAPADGGDRGEEDGEDGRGGDFGADNTGGSSAPGVYLASSVTCAKFAAYSREEALAHAPVLESSRVQIKCVAVRCILLALAHINGNPLHSDLTKARAATEQSLRSIKGKFTSAESLSAVPKYLALFLTDTINLACACATLMIDDKPVLVLQNEAMQLVRQVVELFLFTDDPDTKMTQDSSAGLDSITMIVEGRLLHQFTSQLISAVRNGLSNTAVLHSSDLLFNSGMLLCSLIRGGFITDKIVLRRLVKLVVSYCEQGGNLLPASASAAAAESTPTSEPLPVRAPESPSVSAERSAVMHLVHGALLAELYRLGASTDEEQTRFISATVKSAVASMVQEHCGVLSPLWLAMSVDAVRVMWANHAAAIPSKRSGAHELDALFGSVSLSEPSTPGSTEGNKNIFHPLRGGLTYSAATGNSTAGSSIHPGLQSRLQDALPVTVAAYISSCGGSAKPSLALKGKSASSSTSSASSALPAIPPTKVLPLFAVAHSSLCALLGTKPAVSVDQGALEHVLYSLLMLARKDAPTQDNASEPHPYVIPASEWTDLLALVATHLPRVRSTTSQRSVAELAAVLASRLGRMKTSGEPAEAVDALWLALWKVAISMTRAVDARLLPDSDARSAESLQLPKLASAADLVTSLAGSTSSVPVVATLSKLAEVKPAVAQYVQSLLSLLLIVEITRAAELANIAAIIRALASAPSGNVCVQLLQNMHDWVIAYFASGSSSDVLPTQVVENTLLAWRAVGLQVSAEVPAPFQLNALILNTTQETVPVLALNAAIKFIQTHSGDLGVWTAGQVLPALLTRLSFTKDTTEVRVLLVKALLLFFGLVPASQKSALVELFLTPLCAKICENPTDGEFLLVCGRGVTHLARLEPDVFRTQVPCLTERHRTVLQGVMKLALQQGEGGGFAAQGSASGSASAQAGTAGAPAPSGMTINMSKYKK